MPVSSLAVAVFAVFFAAACELFFLPLLWQTGAILIAHTCVAIACATASERPRRLEWSLNGCSNQSKGYLKFYIYFSSGCSCELFDFKVRILVFPAY